MQGHTAGRALSVEEGFEVVTCYREKMGGMSRVVIEAPPILGERTLAMLARRSPRRTERAFISFIPNLR